MPRARGPRDYLFHPPNSRMWWLKLQLYGAAAIRAGWSLKRFSLKTDRRAEAEFLAAPFIRDHKLFIAAMKDVPMSRARLMNIPHQGGMPPASPTPPKLYTLEEARLEMERAHEFTDVSFDPTKLVPLMPAVKVVRGSADDESLITAWRRKKIATNHVENDARRTLMFFRNYVSKMPLTECTREDGEKLVDLLFEKPKGNSYSTVDKSVGLLRSICNVSRIEPNPFSKVMPDEKNRTSIRSKTRTRLRQEDMATLMANLDKLTRPEDRLLFRLLAYTGMRVDEAFQIREEEVEDGVRHVWVGTKTDSSYRRVTFPTILLPFLPPKINDWLFAGEITASTGKRSSAAAKRLLYWMKARGIGKHARTGEGDPRFVTHSLRHWVAYMMVKHKQGRDTRLWLLGHERDIPDEYVGGYPVDLLLEAVDKIAEVTG